MIKKENLKKVWKDVCESYVMAFCKRHHFTYEPNMWVGIDENNIGTVTEVNDMFVSLDVIRYDVDTNQPEGNFMKWYYKDLELYELGVDKYMNYQSFCKGAPDPWTEDRIKSLREARKNLEKAQDEFDALLDEYTGGNEPDVINVPYFYFTDNKGTNDARNGTDTYAKSDDDN